MTPSKDTLELASTVTQTPANPPASQPKQPSGHLRSDALSLEVPVKVHGSHLPGPLEGPEARPKPFEEQATTMIVFPHGGVLKMSTSVSAGQMIVLTNVQSRQDAICRVVKVRPNPAAQNYVEVEFTNRQLGYWGVHFPADGAEAARHTAQPVAPGAGGDEDLAERAPRAVESIFPHPSAGSARPANAGETAAIKEPPMPRPFVPPAADMPISQFAAIGTREDVQPAASAIPARKPALPSENLEGKPSADIRRQFPPTEAPSAAPSSPPLSMADLRGDARPAPLPAPTAVHGESTPRSAGAAPHGLRAEGLAKSSADSASRVSQTAPSEIFGVRLDGTRSTASMAARPRGNGAAIAAGIAILLVGAAGGIFYLRRPAGQAPAPSQIAAAEQPGSGSGASENGAGQAAARSEPSDANHNLPAASKARPNELGASASSAIHEPAAAARSKISVGGPHDAAASLAPGQPENPSAGAASNETAGLLGSRLNSRPVMAPHRNREEVGAAPALDPTASEDAQPAALSGNIGGASVPLPPPRPQTAGPGLVRVGGDVKPPALIHSVLPSYPQMAWEAGVEGNVVIDTVVGKDGSVTSEKVISGPLLLRPAALEALRKWRYQPPKLNGQPISMEIVVTMRFHR